MKPEKTFIDQILNWLINLPIWLKNGIALIGLAAGFLVSFRNDKYLYSVVTISLIVCYLLGLSLFVLLKREPSPFGGKGAYKYYLLRPLAKVVFGVTLLFAIVLLLLTQNNNKLLEVSSSWDHYCDNVVLLGDDDLPLVERAYYDLSKGDKQEYNAIRDQISALDYSYEEPGDSWNYIGLSLLLNGGPHVTETIILKNEVEVLADVLPVSDMVNILMPYATGCGGGSEAYHFSSIHLFPEINAVSENKAFDYFSIVPSEILYFTFDFVCETPGIYNLEFKIPYSYQGKNGKYKYLDNHSILCPKAFSVYEYWVDGAMQRHPHSPDYDIESLPGDEVFGKLTKTGEYHITNNGEYTESLDWLPKDKIPPLPFWRTTVFNNRNFEGAPIYVDNIKIENNLLEMNFIKFSLAKIGDRIIFNNNDYSIVLETEQHFFGGSYKICVQDFYNDEPNIITGVIQVDIDHQPVTPFFGATTGCVDSFSVSNGNHIVSIKFINDESPVQDAHFSIYFGNVLRTP